MTKIEIYTKDIRFLKKDFKNLNDQIILHIDQPGVGSKNITQIFKDINVNYKRIGFKTWELTPNQIIQKETVFIIYLRLIALLIFIINVISLFSMAIKYLAPIEWTLKDYPLITSILSLAIISLFTKTIGRLDYRDLFYKYIGVKL